MTVTAGRTSYHHHLVSWRLLAECHVLHHISKLAMSLPIIREREEDGDSPESDSELETCPSTVHHKTRRETSFSLEGALVSRSAECTHLIVTSFFTFCTLVSALIDLIDHSVDCYHLSARGEIINCYLFQPGSLRHKNRSYKQPGLAAHTLSPARQSLRGNQGEEQQ